MGSTTLHTQHCSQVGFVRGKSCNLCCLEQGQHRHVETVLALEWSARVLQCAAGCCENSWQGGQETTSLLLQRTRRRTARGINVTFQLLHQTMLLNSTSNLAVNAAAEVSHNLCLEVELIIIWNECWYTSQIVFNIKSVAIIYQVSLYGVSLKSVIHFESYMHILKWTAHLMSNPGGYCGFWFKTRLPRRKLTCQNGNLFGCSLYISSAAHHYRSREVLCTGYILYIYSLTAFFHLYTPV